tara:strand:- start:8241 stop:8486 length:246 start_codon:yes stop_codon:yes gene_type:complete
MDIRDYSPNVKIYKDKELVFSVKRDPTNNNYVVCQAFSDEGVAQIINKFVPLKENLENEYKILYARARGEDYKVFKKNGLV